MHPNPQPPARPTPQPQIHLQPHVPTAWESVPGFIRFMIWVGAVVGFVYAIVIPVLLIMLLVGGGLAAVAA